MDFGFPQSLNPPVVEKSPNELDSREQDRIIKNIQKMLLLYHPEGCKSDLLSRFYKMRYGRNIEPEMFGERNWKLLIKNKNIDRLSCGNQKTFETVRALKLSTNSKIYKKRGINEAQGYEIAKNIQTMLLLYYNDGLEMKNLSKKYKEHFDKEINFNVFPSRTNNQMLTSPSWKETLKDYKFFSFSTKKLFEHIKPVEFVEAEEINNVHIIWERNPPNPNNSNSLNTQIQQTQQIASTSNYLLIPTHTPFYFTPTPQAPILSPPQPNSSQSQSTQPIVEALKNEAANEDMDTQSTSTSSTQQHPEREYSSQSQTHYTPRKRKQDYDSERRHDYKYNGKNWQKRDHSYKNRDRYESYKCYCEDEYHDSKCTYKGVNFNYGYRARYSKSNY